MLSNWVQIPLEDACIGIFDCPHSTPKLSESGPLMVRTQDIRQGYFDTSAAVRVSEETYTQRTKRVEPQHGDLLFSREGTYFGDAAEVPENTRVCLGQRMVLIRPDSQILRAGYLRAQINSPAFQTIIRQQRDGTVAERLNLPAIRRLPIVVPPLDFQDFVLRNLTPIENKIELNRQMSETVEAMAQALFKSWFVDFDPVIDNALAAGNEIPEALQKRAAARQALGDQRKPLPADIQSLFPDRFVFTDEMGWVPKGWDVGVFAHLCDVRKGLSYKGKSLTDDTSKTPMMNLGNFGGAGKFRTEKIKYYEGDYKDRHKVRVGQLMIANTDMTQDRVVLGSPIVVPPFQSSEVIFTHHTFAVDFNNEHPEGLWKWYLYFVSLGSEFRKRAEGFSTGTTVLAMPKDALLQCEILLPPQELVEVFVKQVTPFFNKRDLADQQNSELGKIRDTLLPKLLSGELRIPDAEKQVAEAV